MFCELESDQKTFEYILYYLHTYQSGESFISLDQKIQSDELRWHISQCEGCDDNHDIRTKESLLWIQQNAKAFRSYLNTIKLVFLVYHCDGNDWRDITWEEFTHIRGKLNEVKNICLDTIFLEKVV